MSLDPDIDTEDALALLSTPDLGDRDEIGPYGWTRRRFLQAVGAGVFGGATIGTIAQDFFGGDVPEAWAGTPIGPNDGILIVITLYGGNDMLNTWVPYSNGTYYSSRPNGMSIPQAQVLAVNGDVGFAPQLTYLKALYDAGQVGVVQGVGYGSPDLSHFTSMAIWMHGRFGGGPASNGWIGRWLDGVNPAVADLAAASLDSSVPLHMQGAVRRAAGIPAGGGLFGFDNQSSDQRMYSAVRQWATPAGLGALHDSYTSTLTRQLDLANEVAPAFRTALPSGGDLTRKLTIAARLINANLGFRVLDVSRGGLDTHENQNNALPGILTDLNSGLQAFYATLSPTFRDRVTLVTLSEFGRTVRSNGTAGTDHGTTNAMFVIGSNVRGGLYGQMPSLTSLDRNGRLISSLDFRTVYGNLLDGWLGGGGSTIVNSSFEHLALFRQSPGAAAVAPTPIVLGPSAATGFVSLSPVRVFDTRDGTGGRVGAVGPGEEWQLVLAGANGVPDDATAVAINTTAVDATAATFITAWPTGTAKPFTANLNVIPNQAVPNLVVGRIGPGGRLSLYNNSGHVHLVGDLVGYFTSSTGSRLQPLDPFRLLDTRDGTGAAAAPLGPGASLNLQVTNRGGVPANARAVALNVAVTGPTEASYLTVWPAGDLRPLAASANFVAGQTVPNLVLARVGADGKVSIYNNSGSTHVVADVLGAFTDNAPGRFVAVQPARVLDTREGIGAPLARVGQTPVSLKLTGVGGVPGSGVSAVLMNVTVVSPSMGTYITVYPNTSARPLAANLNAEAGQVIPNMVIGRLGTDGHVAIYNNSGDVDIVADLMGYFTT
jgi:uncharacterized protein (DUF1501 family)